MVPRKATLNDIGLLVRLRLDFIGRGGNALSGEEETRIASRLEQYYARHIPAGDFIARIAEKEGEIISAGFLVIGERPAGRAFPTGITGTLINIVTYPGYRRAGYATQVVRTLIADARESGASAIDLNATEQGLRLYEKEGFEALHDRAMRLKL